MKIDNEVLEVLEVMKESIKLSSLDDEEELERIDMIEEYIRSRQNEENN